MKTINPDKICRYCGSTYQKDSEHVFPFGLGGEDIYMTCVCGKCNNSFSGLERELYQKSPLAFIRSIEGVTGYEASQDKPAPFKAPLLLTFDEKNKIVYEVGQYQGMKVSVRPQIMSIEGKFYIEGDTEEGVRELNKKIIQWKRQNLKLITGFSEENRGIVRYAEFSREKNYSASIIEGKLKTSKNEIIASVLEETNELYPFLLPRIYVDDEKQLRVRARTVDEAIVFTRSLLDLTSSPTILKSFNEEPLHDSVIYVGQSFNNLKLERAVVKIALNGLIHYFPEIKNTPKIDGYISFVQTGQPVMRLVPNSKNTVTDSQQNTHNVFFYQREQVLFITLSLFNGTMSFTCNIPDLKILKINEYNRLLIDYKNRKNIFQNQVQFFQSFDDRRPNTAY